MIAMMRRHTLTPEIPGRRTSRTPSSSSPPTAPRSSPGSRPHRRRLLGPLAVVRGRARVLGGRLGRRGGARSRTVPRRAGRPRPRDLGEDDAARSTELFSDGVVWHGARAADRGRTSRRRWNELGAGATSVEWRRVYADATHVVGVLEVSRPERHAPIRQANDLPPRQRGKASAVWSLPADAAILEALETGEPVREHPNLARSAPPRRRAHGTCSTPRTSVTSGVPPRRRPLAQPVGQGPGAAATRSCAVRGVQAVDRRLDGADLGDVFADDTHAVSLVRLKADRPDRPDSHMDVKEANVFHLDDKGRAYEFWGVADDQAAINSFWTD